MMTTIHGEEHIEPFLAADQISLKIGSDQSRSSPLVRRQRAF